MLDNGETREKKKKERIRGKNVILKRVVRRINEVTCGQGLGASLCGYLRTSMLGHGSSQCKGPEPGVCLVQLRKCKEPVWLKSSERGDKWQERRTQREHRGL